MTVLQKMFFNRRLLYFFITTLKGNFVLGYAVFVQIGQKHFTFFLFYL